VKTEGSLGGKEGRTRGQLELSLLCSPSSPLYKISDAGDSRFCKGPSCVVVRHGIGRNKLLEGDGRQIPRGRCLIGDLESSTLLASFLPCPQPSASRTRTFFTALIESLPPLCCHAPPLLSPLVPPPSPPDPAFLARPPRPSSHDPFLLLLLVVSFSRQIPDSPAVRDGQEYIGIQARDERLLLGKSRSSHFKAIRDRASERGRGRWEKGAEVTRQEATSFSTFLRLLPSYELVLLLTRVLGPLVGNVV